MITGSLSKVRVLRGSELAHGIGMFILFLFWFPVGAFIKKYLKHLEKARILHASIQALGFILIFVFLGIVAHARGDISFRRASAHAIVGVILIVFISFLVLIGSTAYWGNAKIFNSLKVNKSTLKRIHRYSGPVVLLVGIVQVALGINSRLPLSSIGISSEGVSWWVIYFLFLFIWLAVVSILEMRKKMVDYKSSSMLERDATDKHLNSARDSHITSGSSDSHSGAKRSSMSSQKPTTVASIPTEPVPPMPKKRTSNLDLKTYQLELPPAPIIYEEHIKSITPITKHKVRSFKWSEINEANRNGSLYIVAGGTFVYDVSQWVDSHPGGKRILLQVLGTDITNDFFNEDGFDKDKMANIPYKQLQAVDYPSQPISPPSSTESTLSSSTVGRLSSQEETVLKAHRCMPITKQDLSLVLKCRRVHSHGNAAKAKIISFLAGNVISRSPTAEPVSQVASTVSTSFSDAHMQTEFDANEFRRYSMTEKILVNRQAGKKSSPVYKMRFCLVYPFTTERSNEPKENFPFGSCVEIELRLNDDSIVSKLYTPISGNLQAFEIYVKAYDNGCVSRELGNSKPGLRQIKIRGPVKPHNDNTSLPLQLSTPLGKVKPGILEKKYVNFIAGGTGIVSFIQMLNDVFLPTNTILEATCLFDGDSVPDGLLISPGDRIYIQQRVGKGWAFGNNLKSQSWGIFPMSLFTPQCAFGAMFTLFNCVRDLDDIFGTESILDVQSVYPGIVHIHHIVSNTDLSGVDEGDLEKYGGSISFGSLSENLSNLIVEEKRSSGGTSAVLLGHGEAINDEPDYYVVSGPLKYESAAKAMLAELGIDHHNVVSVSERFV